METRRDWNEVVELKPQGYLELNDGKRVLHGPMKEIRVTELDMVEIELAWTAQLLLGAGGMPTKDSWIAVPNETIVFPNLVVPFVVENTPEKGQRIRFDTNLLYLGKVGGVNPKMVKGLEL